MRNSYKIFVRIQIGKRRGWRSWRRFEDIIKIDPNKIVRNVMDCVQLAQEMSRW